MKKSSLKTFLKGENLYEFNPVFPALKGATGLVKVVGYDEAGDNSTQFDDSCGETWYCDVLDDGTAITYCRD